MKKLCFLLILPLVLLIFWCGKDKIDIRDTGFEYDVDICDKFFKLAGCIIDKNDSEKYTEQMKIDLKNEIKQMQEKWKQLNEKELVQKCTESMEAFETEEMRENLNSFGCSKFL